MKSIFLNRNISKRIENGHPWIFGNEVNRGKALDTAAKGGEVVEVYTHDKKFIGKGYINPQSQIMIRLLTREKNEIIDNDFFLKKNWNRMRKNREVMHRIFYTFLDRNITESVSTVITIFLIFLFENCVLLKIPSQNVNIFNFISIV